MGDSTTGDSCLSDSSGVGSSGSVLSKDVSDAMEPRTALGGYVGLVTMIAVGLGRSGLSSIGVGERIDGVRLSLLV